MTIFSYHAIQKLNVYNISQEEILVAMNENIYYNCEDLITKKLIVIFEYKNGLLAAVKDN